MQILQTDTLIEVVDRICLKIKAFQVLEGYHFVHPRRPKGSQSGREKRRDESFQARAEEPWVPTLLLCPMGKQHLLSSFREFVHDGYSWVSEDAFHHFL